MAIILPEVPIVVASNIFCIANRLGVRNELLFKSFSSSSCSNFDDTVVDVEGRVMVAVVGIDTNVCAGEEANAISGNRNIRWVVAMATMVPSAELLLLILESNSTL